MTGNQSTTDAKESALYEVVSELLKWVAAISAISYTLGFLILFNFQLDLTSTPLFEFPDARALIVGFGTLFIVALCQIAYSLKVPLEIEESPFAVYAEIVIKKDVVAHYLYIGLVFYVKLLFPLALVLQVSNFFLSNEFSFERSIQNFSLTLFLISFILVWCLKVIKAEIIYKRIWCCIYFAMTVAFTFIALSKLVVQVPLSIWLFPTIIMLAKHPVVSLFKNHPATSVLEFGRNIYTKIDTNNVSFIFIVLIFLKQYSIYYYPKINVFYGGGESIPVQIGLVDDVNDKRFMEDAVLLSETGSEFIVQTGADDDDIKIYRLNKDSVSFVVKVDRKAHNGSRNSESDDHRLREAFR